MESVVGGMLVKERPILMTPENAQKCHEGRKTQTRRIICARSYGVVGDRLWVREGWCKTCDGILYRGQCEEYKSLKPIWKPSIYMPREFARTVLEITEVRVEQLQEISAADALAEGVFCPEVGYAQHGDRAPVLLYASLWESIHGAGSWALNPWVWVIEFRKVEEDVND